jgi:hypothetical protein
MRVLKLGRYIRPTYSNRLRKMAPTYTLYYGRFIQLPRQQVTKPSLDINTGVLWVSNADGTIQGFDWSVPVSDDDAEGEGAALSAFVQEKGWTVVENGSDDGPADKETVVIVKGGRKGGNSFFFPGFIGQSFSSFYFFFGPVTCLTSDRYAHPCFTVP